MKIQRLSFLFLCLLLSGTALPVLARTPGEIAVGLSLRPATMQGLNGPQRKLSEFRGKPLVINVWASWCAPCRAEMASLDRLARRYGDRFNVIGISTDDYPEAASAFLEKAGVAFSQFIDHRLELENMLGADRIPLTLLIDSRGRVLAKHYGARDWDSPDAVELIGKTFNLSLR